MHVGIELLLLGVPFIFHFKEFLALQCLCFFLCIQEYKSKVIVICHMLACIPRDQFDRILHARGVKGFPGEFHFFRQHFKGDNLSP